ncbi:MAG: hypothetical protein IPL47_07435 [Phyllobacteriaceae bacterium]|nr:hypothetical protein [Phyllobacteriaceae bacterium]
MRKILLALLIIPVPGFPALADPTGKFDVRGQNPDTGGTYSGTVTVKKTGETYDVKWVIAGDTYRGVGIGALIKDGSFVAGPAHPDDTSLAVGYISGNSFGMAQYFLQPDGSWKGAWTYGGSGKVAIEEWRKK